MQTAATGIDKTLCHVDRVVGIYFGGGVLATCESDAFASDNIYGRNNLNHKQSQVKKVRE